MRTQITNKMSESDPPCHCSSCRRERAGVRVGDPLTPADFLKVNPPAPDARWSALEEDAGVRRAAKDLSLAQDAYDAAELRWSEAVRAAQAAALAASNAPMIIGADGGPLPSEERAAAVRRQRIRELDAHAAELRIVKDRKWVPLAKARDEHAAAWRTARTRLEQ